jgi:peptidoglycan/LPS O-acetylase OafA/YrhL
VTWALRVALLVAAGVLAWRLSMFAHQEYWGSWSLALRAAGLALGVYAGFSLALVTVTALFLRQKPPIQATATALLLVGLVAAIPVDFSYDDGCNDHTTVSPAGFVPILALSRPESATLSYQQSETLVLCPT